MEKLIPNLYYLILASIIMCHVYCLEKEITINVQPGKEDCFYERVKNGEVIDLEYQVIDGGHGDLDITFHLVDSNGRILKADFKKSENSHRIEATVDGDYRFCFDNTFSSFNAKTVFFELIIEGDDSEWSDTDKIEGIGAEEVYELTVQEIHDVITRVRNTLSKARHFQDVLKSMEARDRNVAEENYFKVNTFSLFQITIMVVVGIIQVIMVRSLFDDSSKVHKIWKGFSGR